MDPKPVDEALVSVIIPTYNRANLIKETLDSVLNQIYQNWECIIVDDGSDDDTENILEQYIKVDERIKYVKRPGTYLPGGNGARNFGFDLAKGDFIQWFDSDDLMNDDFISAKIEMFDKYPESQSVISLFTFFEENSISDQQYNFNNKYPEFFENTITVKIPVWTPSIIFRKKFLLKCGERLDESLKRLQEYEFLTRIFVKYPHQTQLLDKSLCLVRKHENTKTSAFNDAKSLEMYEAFFIANHKIVSLLMQNNKLTKNLESFFYNDHKRYISYSLKLQFNEVAEKFRMLVMEYLKHNKNYIRQNRFSLGYALYKLIPIPNFFLVYEIKNPILLSLKRNINRLYKVLFKKGYLSYHLKKSATGNPYNVNNN